MDTLDETAVQPVDGTPPPVQPTEEQPTEESTAKPPVDEKLLQIPAMAGLFAGKPGALSSPIKNWEKRPTAKLIVDNKDDLLKAGIGFYRSLNGETGVVFNQMVVHPEELKQADKAGQLLAVAPNFDQVNQQLSASIPDLSSAAKPGGPTPPAPQVPQFNTGLKQQPASAVRQSMQQRLMNLTPQAATKGNLAGQGQLLKSILKPVV